jgi:hypothetical protein
MSRNRAPIPNDVSIIKNEKIALKIAHAHNGFVKFQAGLGVKVITQSPVEGCGGSIDSASIQV